MTSNIGRTSINSAARRVWQDPGVRAAGFAFALSRLAVLLLFILVGHFTVYAPSFNGEVQNSLLSLRRAPVARKLRTTVLTADINWYVGIAEQGYDKQQFATDRPHNWAFFPLYPLLLRAASAITGEFALTGMTLSHLFLLPALILLYRTAGAFGCDEATCERAVFYLAFSPASYFFSLPLTESLFLLLSVGSFYAARRKAWHWAGALGALASATRVTGVLLLPALFVLYWQQQERPASRPRASVLWLLLIPAGLLAFMLYLYDLTGNALAFKDTQAVAAWGRQAAMFWSPLLSYLASPAEIIAPWDFRLLNFAAAAAAFGAGFFWLKRREWALAAYTLTAIVFSLSSGLLQSHARYVSVVFPVFMALAVAGRAPRVDQTIRVVFLILFGLMTALFAAHFSFALS